MPQLKQKRAKPIHLYHPGTINHNPSLGAQVNSITRDFKKNSTKPDYPRKGADIYIGMQKLGRCTGSYSEA